MSTRYTANLFKKKKEEKYWPNKYHYDGIEEEKMVEHVPEREKMEGVDGTNFFFCFIT